MKERKDSGVIRGNNGKKRGGRRRTRTRTRRKRVKGTREKTRKIGEGEGERNIPTKKGLLI
jgi:hypothetical protein